MASAGVNLPGGTAGDGNTGSASPDCRLRRRRRLSPPPAAAPASGSSSAGPSRRRRSPTPPSPQTSSSEGTAYTVEEEDTEEEYEEARRAMPPLGLAQLAAPARGPPPPQHGGPVWPVAFGSVELAGRMREMEDTVSLHPGFYTWVDGTPMHFFAVFDGHGGTHVSPPSPILPF